MPRNASYDYARLIAAFGIVIFHAHAPGAQIGYAALPFFLMLMIVMAVPGATRQGFDIYSKTRWSRLMRPFVIWSGIYGGLKLAEVALTPARLGEEFALHMLLTGPAIHLWFLPFALVTCLALYPIARIKIGVTGVAVGLLGAALMLQGARQGQSFSAPLAQWVYVAPAACLGLGMALVRHRLAAQAGLAGVFVGLSTLFGWGDGLGQLALAAAALFACGLVHLAPNRGSDLAAGTAMGVYLAHPLALSVLERATPVPTDSLLLAGLGAASALGLTLAWPHLAPALQQGASHLRGPGPKHTQSRQTAGH